MDRWSKHAASWSNMADHKEQTDWETLFEGQMGKLSELYQPHGTHDNAGARSRLDRIYTSSGVADQLDAQLGCAALDWCKHLSDHRPIIFFRRVGRLKGPANPTFLEGPIKHPSWPKRDALEFKEQLQEQGGPQCPLRQLAIFKEGQHPVNCS